MVDDIQRVLIDEQVIEKRIDTIAQKVLTDFEGKEFVVVLLLKGALVFAADLCRRLPVPLQLECLNVASYHGGTESSGEVHFLDQKMPEVKGKSVLLVDDILDTGRTLAAVKARFLAQGSAEVKCCVLLSKDKERAEKVNAEYVGFVIEDEFVVGYGLDYEGRYRNLPFIGVLKPEIFEKQ